MSVPAFRPPLGLTSPHTQTILGSVARKLVQQRRHGEFLAAAEPVVVETGEARLLARVNARPGAPLIVLLPGWLGHDGSSYLVTAGSALWQAGYAVARLNLRDHGGSERLNEGLFNCSLIDEVVAAVDRLGTDFGCGETGVAGFSLGGNFTLRVARARPELRALAICPAFDPGETLRAIDAHPIYQRYFIRKWRRGLFAKSEAFPHLYDFSSIAQLSTVGALNDFFVRYHSPWADAEAYFATYDLRGNALASTRAHLLAARDDPIIAASQYENLPAGITMELTDRGGHGAYLKDWALRSWADDYVLAHFDRVLGRGNERGT